MNENTTAIVMEMATVDGSVRTQARAGRYDCMSVQTPAKATSPRSLEFGTTSPSLMAATAADSVNVDTDAYSETHIALMLPKLRSHISAIALANAENNVLA